MQKITKSIRCRIFPVFYLLLYVSSAWLLAINAQASGATHATPGLLLQSSSTDSIHGANILLLVADDFGYNDSAIYQDVYHQAPVTTMPALESLAKQGMRFTRFYTESTCSASRAALLTGQYSARNGFMPIARGLSPDLITLPEYLQSKGYATHLVGKWHAGEINQQALPQHQGFDTAFGFLSQWFLKGPDKAGKPELKSPTYNNPWLMDVNKTQQTSKQYQGHLEDILTQRTIALIQDAKKNKQPWFIDHAFLAPHTPLEPAERFASRFENTPEGKYKALLAQMDDNLLQILSALKATGQWDNTIIIFLSDNGSTDKHANSNAPFSGAKTEYEEGGIRTPLIIKWQKSNQLQATRTDVVSIMDIYPSLVSALDGQSADLKNLDGIASLIPDNPQLRTTPLYFLSYGSLSVLSGDGHDRLLREWNAGHFTHTELFRYDENNLPVTESGGLLDKLLGRETKTGNELFDSFMQWRNKWRVVPLHFNDSEITGSDFLRTPINPSWAMAFSFVARDENKKQTLVHQQGSIEVTLEKGNLSANINGLVVQEKNIQSGQCYSVVLSGEFYDRFSNVQGGIHQSHLHLIVNGKEVDTVSGQISSLESIDITEPTHIGNIKNPKIYSTQLLPNDEPIPSDVDEAIKGMCP